MEPDVRVDPVSLNVIGNALVAICEEMAIAIVRAAYSSIVRESRDCSTALLDDSGAVVSQAHRIPLQMNSLSLSFRWLAEHGRLEGVEPDDVFMTNDPYCGAQHLNDIAAFTPTFWQGRLVGFTGTVIHANDIGGSGRPSTDIFAEGLRLPGLRMKRKDLLGGWFEQLIRANVRAPDELIGDLGAQSAANRIGSLRYTELLERYGIDLVRTVEKELIQYSERRVRAAVESLPDGEYSAEDSIDHDGFQVGPFPIRTTLRVSGADLTVDLSGSAPQLTGPANSPLSATLSAVYSFVTAYLLRESMFANEGGFRAVNVIVPYGSLLNPKPPAPVQARSNAANRVYSTLKLAFSTIQPSAVLAGGQDAPCQIALRFRHEHGYQVVAGAAMGGWGAAPDADGQDALSSQMSNATNLPIEYEENTATYYRVLNYELIPDSGGEGKFRGGLAQRRTYEILADGVLFIAHTDRFLAPAWGLFGGKAGRPGNFIVVRNGERTILPPICSFPLLKGDILITEMTGGGGYGPLAERDPLLVQKDLEEARVTRGASGLAADGHSGARVIGRDAAPTAGAM